MKKFLELRAKTYAYLMDDDNEKKKLTEQKNASSKNYFSLMIRKITY